MSIPPKAVHPAYTSSFLLANEIIVDGLAVNMAPLIKQGNFGAIQTDNDASYGYEIVQFKSDAYAL